MPGISKDKIKIDSYDKSVEIKSEDPTENIITIEVPEDTDINSAK